MQTATNHETGERFGLVDGQWVPLDDNGQPVGVPVTAPRAAALPGLIGALGSLTPAGLPAAAVRLGTRIGAERPREKALAVGQAPFGFGDEIQGALGAAFDVAGGLAQPSEFGERYRTLRDAARGELEQYREERPVESALMEMGAGLAAGGPVAARLAATSPARAAGQALAAMPGLVRVPAAAAAAGAAAAPGGALQGVGTAPELVDVPGAAARGATTAALTAAPIVGGIEALLSPAQRVTRAVRRMRGGGQTPDEIRADRRLRATFEEAGVTGPEEATRRMESAGAGAPLAAIGEGPRKELQYVAQRPGQTGQRVEDVFRGRTEEIAEEVEGLAGAAQKHRLLDDINATRSRSASPLYEQAYAEPTEVSSRLREMFETDMIQEIWKSPNIRRNAQATAVIDRLPYDRAMFDTAEPSSMGWDHLVRELDRVINANKVNNPSYAGQVSRIRREMMDEIGQGNPALAEARAVWAGGERFKDLMDEGQKLFKGATSDFVNEAGRLNPVDRAAWFEGAKQAIADAVNSPTAGDFHDATKKLRTRGIRQRLRELFPSQEEYDDFYRRIDQLAEQQSVLGAARPRAGSQTGGLEARQDESGAVETAEAVGNVAAAPTSIGAWRRAIEALNPTAPNRAVRDITGSMLLEMDPQRQAEIINRIYGPIPGLGGGLLPITGSLATGGLLARPEPPR